MMMMVMPAFHCTLSSACYAVKIVWHSTQTLTHALDWIKQGHRIFLDDVETERLWVE